MSFLLKALCSAPYFFLYLAYLLIIFRYHVMVGRDVPNQPLSVLC